ncbi:hypothetical protein [Scytonema sp. NUACC26]|uniref:hypothetical protein n=1 Tax=Scytonema sp. NUACC26 TaxID=3140176 RepID=UPI0034DBA7AC
MNHPFALDISDLEALELNFEENLSDEEANQVTGGLKIATTKAFGEEGGGEIVCISAPCPGSEGGDDPRPKPRPTKPQHPTKPPEVTTLALGEEGGHPVTKTRLEAGGSSIDW